MIDRQILQLGNLLFVIYPRRNEVWIFNEHFHIGRLNFMEMMIVLNKLKSDDSL